MDMPLRPYWQQVQEADTDFNILEDSFLRKLCSLYSNVTGTCLVIKFMFNDEISRAQ
jgi:hypothetical protein